MVGVCLYTTKHCSSQACGTVVWTYPEGQVYVLLVSTVCITESPFREDLAAELPEHGFSAKLKAIPLLVVRRKVSGLIKQWS